MSVRINKWLADNGYASRREADVLIEKGSVFINAKKAKLGDQVEEGDTVEVRGNQTDQKANYAYNKPVGVVTVNAQTGEEEILSRTKFPEKVYPVGRLDKDSEGLVIMTNDGRLAKKLLSEDVEKEYAVTLDKPITHQFLIKMKHGVTIGGAAKDRRYKTKPVKIRKVGDKRFDIVLVEGKNRQIRRMCSALGYTVTALKRFRVGSIELGSLKKGQYRRLKPEELGNLT